MATAAMTNHLKETKNKNKNVDNQTEGVAEIATKTTRIKNSNW